MTSVLTHPNTISIYDYGRTSAGTLYYAMEYLDGLDLDGLVTLDGPQPPERVVHLLRQICGALGEAHESGLIHRDIKPGNVLLCSRAGSPDLIKVVDFGLVKALEAPRDLAATAANQIVGTPLYLSPESIMTPDGVDARSDLYALGALAYFLLVGQPPFTGPSAVVVCGHHLHTAPVSPATRLGRPTLQLDELVLWCLKKTPDERPASADALARSLTLISDLPEWTAERAHAWWRLHRTTISARREAAARTPALGQTIAVDLRQRPEQPI
jgi:serine/threonine protein kinase